MKRRTLAALVSLLLLLSLAANTMADGGDYPLVAGAVAVVNNPEASDRLNLRTRPSQDAPSLGKYYNGTYVEVVSDQQYGWVKVRIFGLEGYMMAQFLVYAEQLTEGAATVPSVRISNAGGTGLHLRKGQSTSSPSLGLYPNGTAVRVFGVSEAWCHVQTADGQVGFMLRERLSPVLEYQKSGAQSTAVVNNPNSIDRLNLRTRPSQDAPALGKYYSGVTVEVLGSAPGGWTKVRFHSLEGYMMTSYLAFGEDQFEVAYAVPSVTIANAGGTGLHLRKGQSTDSASLGLYPNGAAVQVFGVGETWCHVQTADGQVGFMLRERLSPSPKFDLSHPTGDDLEGSWFGAPGDPITDDFMPGGNG